MSHDDPRLRQLLDSLAADLNDKQSQGLQFSLLDLRTGEPVYGAPHVTVGFPRVGYLVVTDGSKTVIDAQTVAEVVVACASVLQDRMMDELGRGWPELYEGDRFRGLLVPTSHEGAVGWRAGDIFVPLGELWRSSSTH